MSIRTHIIKSTMLLSSLFIIGQVAEAVTVDVGGSIRPRVEYVDEGGQGQTVGQSKTHTTMQTRINVKATIDESVSAFIQIQDVRTWGGETPTGAPPSITRTGTATAGHVDFHQAYIVIKGLMDTGLNLKIGRQEMVFDEARLIGNIGWIQQAQSFDAARIDMRSGDFGITAFYAQTVANDTHPTLGTLPQSTAAESEFLGLRGTFHLQGKDRITAYFYGANDANGVVALPAALGTTVVQKLYTAGLYAAATFNGVRFRVDTAYQFGEVTPTVDVEAYMMTASVGKNLDIAEGGRLEFWADYLSGDDGNDPLKMKKFIIPYGTNHKFYGHVDKFLNNPTTGLIDLVVKFNVKPTAKLKLQVHAHKFYAAEDLNAAGDTNLGSEIDLQASYALAANTRLRIGYSRYFAGDLAAAGAGVAGTPSVDTNWAWMMMQTKF